MMQNVDLGDGTAFRGVAIDLQPRFCPEIGEGPQEKEKAVESKPPVVEAAKESETSITAPLDFELKGLDFEHPYLRRRGFLSETIAHFGLGYCSRGMLKERLAIPL